LWAATVFYVSMGFDLYFRSKACSRHMRNLTTNPRVAATINEDAEDWRAIKGIQLEGRVDVVSRHDETRRVMEAFSLRYPFVETLWGVEEDSRPAPNAQRMVFHVLPERIVFCDHGHSNEICELGGPDLSAT
jgi:hypothetical protein